MGGDGPAGGPPRTNGNPVQIPVLERTTTRTRLGNGEAPSPLGELWLSGAYRLVVMYIIYVLGFTVLMPFLSTLQTDFFASERAGRPMECTGLKPGEKPPEVCIKAHSDVVFWQSWTAFATHAVLSVYLNPAIGTWSDIYGRRPFIIIGIALMILPLTVVLLYLENITTLYWYWPASVIANSVSSFTVAGAYLGDVISEENRTVAFGIYGGTFSVSSILGSFINISGIVRNPKTATGCAIVSCAFATGLAAFWLQESSSMETRMAADEKAHETGVLGGGSLLSTIKKPLISAWASLKILGRNSLFIRLTATVMIMMIVFEESMVLLFQYLQETVGFDTMDQSIVMAIYGVGGLFTAYMLLGFLYSILGLSEKWVLIIGISATGLEQLALIFIREKWQAFAVIGMSTLGGLSFPAIQGIKSKSVGPDEQGAIQGALVGARSFATGVGPFFFLTFFNTFRKGHLYFPGAPFVATSVLMAIAITIACTIRLPATFLEIQHSGRRKQLSKSLASFDENQEKVPLLPEV